MEVDIGFIYQLYKTLFKLSYQNKPFQTESSAIYLVRPAAMNYQESTEWKYYRFCMLNINERKMPSHGKPFFLLKELILVKIS